MGNTSKASTFRTLLNLLLIAKAVTTSCPNDVDAILGGLPSLYTWAPQSMLNVYGSSACSILTGIPNADQQEIPYLAASRDTSSGGRLIVSATDESVEYATVYPNTGLLLRNLIQWAAGGKSNVRVALYCKNSGVNDLLNHAGFQATFTGRAVLDNPETLDNYDVFVTSFPVMAAGGIMKPNDIQIIQNFLRKGKGLVLANNGYDGDYTNSTFMRHDSLFNRLISPFGISLVARNMYGASNWNSPVNKAILSSVHATNAFQRFSDGVTSGSSLLAFPRELIILRNLVLSAPGNETTLLKLIKFWDLQKFGSLATGHTPREVAMVADVESAIIDFKMHEFGPPQVKNPDDVDLILEGIPSLYIWAPQSMLNIFSSAFAILTGIPNAEKQEIPYLAGSRDNSSGGRLIVSATDELIEFATTYPNSGQLLRNTIQWAAGGKSNVRVALYCKNSGVNDLLNHAGFKATFTGRSVLDNPEMLDNYDVFVTSFPVMAAGGIMKPNDIQIIQNFLRKGKGLVLANNGYDGDYTNSTFMRHDSLFNRLISPFGISLVARNMYGASNWNSPVNKTVLSSVHAANTFKTFSQGVSSGNSPLKFPRELVILRNLVLSAPANETILNNLVKFWDPVKLGMLASDKKPLDVTMVVVVDSAILDFIMDESDPSQIKAHPSSLSFPSLGATKFGSSVTKIVEIKPDNRSPEPIITNEKPFSSCVDFDVQHLNSTKPYLSGISGLKDTSSWYSTGLYAPPGTKITVTFPGNLDLDKVFVQIGAHTDDLFSVRQPSYKRYPRVVYKKYASVQTIMASPFGGFLYVILPSGSNIQPFNAQISGAVEMLPYTFGGSSQKDWDNRRKLNASAPWIELINKNGFILTVPYSVAAYAPASVLEQYLGYMGQVISNEYSVAKYSGIIPSIRWVIDRQITNGGAHNGYPVMSGDYWNTHIATPGAFCRDNGWVWSHEIGHNFQYVPMQFVESLEVTNNIFSVYNAMNICSKDLGSIFPNMNSNVRTYINGGRKWVTNDYQEVWIYPYMQLATKNKKIDWTPIKQMFSFYNELRRGTYPTRAPDTLQERIDMAVVVLSKITQTNLTPFFESYGIHVSTSTQTCLANFHNSTMKLDDMLTK